MPLPSPFPPSLPFSVYLITDPRRIGDSDLISSLPHLLDAVPPLSVAIQLRDKGRDLPSLKILAASLLEITRPREVLLLVNVGNHSVKSFLDLPVDGFHLPADAPDGPGGIHGDRLWGMSCHDAPQLEKAAKQGANFTVLSPVFPTAGKAVAGEEMGLDRFSNLARARALPVLALGGITPERVEDCRNSGASGVAVMSFVWGAARPEEALRRLVEAWKEAAPDPVAALAPGRGKG